MTAMNLKYATILGLLGMAIAIVMGIIAMANAFIYAQKNPGADMTSGYLALLAAVIAVASWVAPVKLGRRVGGLALVAAGVCNVVLVTPPVAALFLAVAGLLLLTAPAGEAAG